VGGAQKRKPPIGRFIPCFSRVYPFLEHHEHLDLAAGIGIQAAGGRRIDRWVHSGPVVAHASACNHCRFPVRAVAKLPTVR